MWILFDDRLPVYITFFSSGDFRSIKMSMKHITGSSTDSRNGSITACTYSSHQANIRINLEITTRNANISHQEKKVFGEFTVNDVHSPGGTRQAVAHFIEAWNMRGKMHAADSNE